MFYIGGIMVTFMVTMVTMVTFMVTMVTFMVRMVTMVTFMVTINSTKYGNIKENERINTYYQW